MNLQILELLGIEVTDQKDVYLGTIEYMDNLSIQNSSDSKELTSGPKMSVLHTVSSNYKSEVSGSAVASTDLFTLLFGETPIKSDTTVMFTTEKGLIPSANKVVLQETPLSNKKMYVFDTTKAGERVELSLGDPTSDPTKYSVGGSGKEVTVNTAVKSVKVSYHYSTKGVEFAKKAKDTPAVKMYALAKYVNLDTKIEDSAVFEMLNAKVDPNFSVSASNEDMAKIDISIKANLDTQTGKSWSLKIKTA